MDERIKGKIVTDEQITRWAAEAEQGFDVESLRQSGRGRPGRGAQPSQVVAVRFTPEEIAILDQKASSRHLTRSELIREALLA